MIDRLLAGVDRRWFAPAPARRLGLVRVVVGVYSLWYLRGRVHMFAEIARTDPHLFRPTGVVRPLERPLPPRLSDAIVVTTLGTNVAFLLGWRHRVVGPAFAGLLLWTLSYRNSWSMIFHSDNVLVLHVAVLGLTPSAAALSLDARAGRRRSLSPPDPDWRFGWPLHVMNGVTVASYAVAGVAKLKGPLGWRWADGESLRRQVAIDLLRKDLLGSTKKTFGRKLYHRVGLFRVLAVGSLVVELAAPLALANRQLGRAWATGAWAMHWGIYAVMGITFRYQLSGVMYAPFFAFTGGHGFGLRAWFKTRRCRRR